MDVLVKLPKAGNMKDIDTLRKMYNSLETSVRNLANLGVKITSRGTLLISIIFDCIPIELKLLTSRKFKKLSYKLRWCCARDLLRSQILLTTGGFQQQIFCIKRRYLTPYDIRVRYLLCMQQIYSLNTPVVTEICD